MKYQGGKHLIGSKIAKIMNDRVSIDKVDGYFEPFCGSLGVYKNMIKYMFDNYYDKIIGKKLTGLKVLKGLINSEDLILHFIKEDKVSINNDFKIIPGYFLSKIIQKMKSN